MSNSFEPPNGRTNFYQSGVLYNTTMAGLSTYQALTDYKTHGRRRYKSIREITQAIGKSRQWVYIYLEALASIEVVDLRGFIDVVISRQNVPKISRKVQKVFWVNSVDIPE